MYFFIGHLKRAVALLDDKIQFVPLAVLTFPFVRFETQFHYFDFIDLDYSVQKLTLSWFLPKKKFSFFFILNRARLN